jgi:hypothetical protein
LLQDPSEIDRNSPNNVRREASSQYGNAKREYSKDKIIELAVYSKNKNVRGIYRGITEFKRGYQPINNLVKCENPSFVCRFSQHFE